MKREQMFQPPRSSTTLPRYAMLCHAHAMPALPTHLLPLLCTPIPPSLSPLPPSRPSAPQIDQSSYSKIISTGEVRNIESFLLSFFFFFFFFFCCVLLPFCLVGKEAVGGVPGYRCVRRIVLFGLDRPDGMTLQHRTGCGGMDGGRVVVSQVSSGICHATCIL
jgi:hypothetical protein